MDNEGYQVGSKYAGDKNTYALIKIDFPDPMFSEGLFKTKSTFTTYKQGMV